MRSIILTFFCIIIASVSVEAQICKDNTNELVPKTCMKIDGSVYWFMEPADEIKDLNTLAPNVCGVAGGMTVMTNESGTDTLGFRINQEGTYIDSVYFLIPVLPSSCGMSDLEFYTSYSGMIDPQTCTAEINWTCTPGFFPGFRFLFDFSANTVALTIRKISNCDSCAAVQFNFAITAAEIQNTEVPDKFYLSQNYPNPFNPSTKINYSIPQPSFVTLKIYDILGNEITTLVDEEKSAGNYVVEFSAEGGSTSGSLSSGLYFYTINSGSFNQVKKMVLLK